MRNKNYHLGLISKTLAYARSKFDDLTSYSNFERNYIERRQVSEAEQTRKISAAQKKRERKNAKRLLNAA